MLSAGYPAEQALTSVASCRAPVGGSCPTAVRMQPAGRLKASESYLFVQENAKRDTWCSFSPPDRTPRSQCGRWWCYLRCAASRQWSAVHERRQPQHSRRRWRHWRNTLLLGLPNQQRRSCCCWQRQAHLPTRMTSSLAITLVHCRLHHLLGARCCKHGECWGNAEAAAGKEFEGAAQAPAAPGWAANQW